MTADDLLELSQQEFKDLVDLDVRGRLDERRAGLLREGSLDVIERWYQALVFMKKNVESTLAAKREENKVERLQYIAQAEALEQGYRLDWVEVEDGMRSLQPVTGAHGRIEYHDPTDDEIREAKECRAKSDATLRVFLKWRTGALRFRAGVEERLSEVSWRRDATDKHLLLARERVLNERIDTHKGRIVELTKAIQAHRDAMADLDDDDIDSTDRDLWALVEGTD